MKMLKTLSFCAALMTAAAAVPVTPVTVFAEDEAPTSGKCGENLTWNYDTETKTLTISGTGDMENYSDGASPSPNNRYSPWLSFKSEIEHIILPNGLTSIGASAFGYKYYNTNDPTRNDTAKITEITIPDTVTEIRSYAFAGCANLQTVSIPNSIKHFGGLSFAETPWLKEKLKEKPFAIVNNVLVDVQGCKGEVAIPAGVEYIEQQAFEKCTEITGIIVPESVTAVNFRAFAIDYYAFADNYNDTSQQLGFVTFLNPDCKIYDSSQTICTIQFAGIASPNGVIPNYPYSGIIRGYDNSTAQAYAEKYNRTFESLGAAPAEEEPVTAATSGICGENMKLKWSYDPASKTLTISGNDRMSMTEFFSAEKGKAGSRAQWKPFAKQMKAVVIEEGVKSISPGAFVADDSESPDDGLLYQNLTSVTIPSSVTEIGAAAFSGTPWLKAQQEKDPMVVVNGILIDGTTASGKVVIPEGVKVIGPVAMFGSEAESVTLPESLTEIQRYAFMHCPNLTGIVLPENVTTLGKSAFEGCEKLTDITVPAGVTDFDARVFDETPWMEAALAANSLVIVNNVVLKANKLAESVEIPETVTKIASFAFRECRHMLELSFPASVQEIGQGALDFNSIGRYTFLNPDCKIHEDNIKSNDITLVGYDGSTAQAFAKTKGYTFVSLGAAPEIEELKGTLSNGTVNWEFDAATKTLSFSGTGDIGHAPWCEFEEILHIQIPEGITEIGSGVFAGDGITEIEIPDTVTKISTYAFTGASLKEVTLPSSVNEVCGGAFAGCEALTAITILNPECRIGEDEAEFFFAICNDYTEDDATRERTPIYTGVIRGYDGSTAEAYANKYGYKFESLGAAPAIPKLEPTLRGDLDLTNVVDVSDAVILARYLVGDDSFAVSDQGLANADADGSGKLTTEDVTYIIKMIVGLV